MPRWLSKTPISSHHWFAAGMWSFQAEVRSPCSSEVQNWIHAVSGLQSHLWKPQLKARNCLTTGRSRALQGGAAFLWIQEQASPSRALGPSGDVRSKPAHKHHNQDSSRSGNSRNVNNPVECDMFHVPVSEFGAWRSCVSCLSFFFAVFFPVCLVLSFSLWLS